jgi:hypothetical protein
MVSRHLVLFSLSFSFFPLVSPLVFHHRLEPLQIENFVEQQKAVGQEAVGQKVVGKVVVNSV